MISERDWLRAARELPEDELLCCPYSNCMHMDQGAHLFYFPFKCQLCEEQLPFCSRSQFEQHKCVQQDGPTFRQRQPIEHYDEAKEAQLHIETGEVVKARMLEKEAMKRAAEEKEAAQAVASSQSKSKTEADPDKKSEHPQPPSSNGATATTGLITKGGFGARNYFRRVRQASVTEIPLTKSEHPPPSPSSSSSRATVEVIKGIFGMRVNFRRSGGGPAA